MKHYTISIILLSIMSQMMGQLPTGKLFTFTNNGTDSAAKQIGYFQFPDQAFIQLDTVSSSDFVVKEGKLYSASGYYFQEKIPTYVYDIQTGQKIDTITGLRAKKLDFWENLLVSVNDSFPYLSVQSPNAPYNHIFSLDSSYLPYSPSDLIIHQNKAFLLYPTEIKIVDLKLQDTLPSVPVYHPYGFGSGLNSYFDLIGDNIYIMVDYVTGALRSSLMAIDVGSFKVDTVFHDEGHAGIYKPIAGNNQIFLYMYKSYYDLNDDSLYIAPPSAPFSFDYMIAHDAESFTDFVWPQTKDSIEIYQSDSLVSKVQPPGTILNAMFIKDSVSSSSVTPLSQNHLRIFPNPVSNKLSIELETAEHIKQIRLYDLSGRMIHAVEVNAMVKKRAFSLPVLANSVYIMHMITDSGSFYRKIEIRR